MHAVRHRPLDVGPCARASPRRAHRDLSRRSPSRSRPSRPDKGASRSLARDEQARQCVRRPLPARLLPFASGRPDARTPSQSRLAPGSTKSTSSASSTRPPRICRRPSLRPRPTSRSRRGGARGCSSSAASPSWCVPSPLATPPPSSCVSHLSDALILASRATKSPTPSASSPTSRTARTRSRPPTATAAASRLPTRSPSATSLNQAGVVRRGTGRVRLGVRCAGEPERRPSPLRALPYFVVPSFSTSFSRPRFVQCRSLIPLHELYLRCMSKESKAAALPRRRSDRLPRFGRLAAPKSDSRSASALEHLLNVSASSYRKRPDRRSERTVRGASSPRRLLGHGSSLDAASLAYSVPQRRIRSRHARGLRPWQCSHPSGSPASATASSPTTSTPAAATTSDDAVRGRSPLCSRAGHG